MGIEPTLSAWEAEVLPLNYTRLCPDSTRRVAAGSIILTGKHSTLAPLWGICRMAITSTGSTENKSTAEARHHVLRQFQRFRQQPRTLTAIWDGAQFTVESWPFRCDDNLR
jgi:hypothetical protein